MADKISITTLRRILMVTAVLGFGVIGAIWSSSVTISSLFDGIRGDGPNQAIDDDLGTSRAGRYVAEGVAAYGTEQWYIDNSRFEIEQQTLPEQETEQETGQEPLPGQETGQETGQQPPPDSQVETTNPVPPGETNTSIAGMDPTDAAMAHLNGEQGAPTSQPNSAQPLSDEIKAILEAQQREDERRALRAQQASIAPLGGSIHSDEDIYGGARRAAAAAASALLEEQRAADLAELNRDVPAPPTAPNQSGHILAAGTVIRAGLLDTIDSELPGLVRAMVTNNVWDTDTGRVIVIPQGSQLLGEYTNASAAGQRRMGITWNRVRFPDGSLVDLDNAVALDEDGGVGVQGRRRNGFLTAVFQTVLLNLAGSVGQTASTSEATTLGNAAQIALGQSASQVGTEYVNEGLARGSIFRIESGTYLNVQITRDFFFPDAVQQRGDLRGQNGPAQPRILQAGGQATSVPYDRALYGDWADADGDCQNTRHEVLELLSTGPVTRTVDGCAIVTGRWLDPYTGQIFTRANQLDVDHLVPLAWAHVRGGAGWGTARRAQFANDLVNLFAVDAGTNRAKGAKGYDEWLPPATDFRCQYILRFERVVQSYGLAYLPSEIDTVQSTRERVCAA